MPELVESVWKALEEEAACKDLMIDDEKKRSECILLKADDFGYLKDLKFKKFLEDQCGTLFCPVACYYHALKKGFPYSPFDPGGLAGVAYDTLLRIGLKEHYERHVKDKIGVSYDDVKEKITDLFSKAIVEEAHLRKMFQIAGSHIEGEKCDSA
ncbi:hypothetical protein KAU55_00445 [Candidatus Bathyarchaeota archaeon]|nr:hypothetical protein [Candidatus Bathyarchaeota archaeon]